MRIAVFHCPAGATGEGILQAFFDASLPVSFLKKELKKNKIDKKIQALVRQVSRQLGEAGIGGKQALGSLISIAAVANALRYFKIEKCFLRNLAIGKKGNPNTLKLLRGFLTHRLNINKELVTPSGASVLAAFCEKEDAIPSMRLEALGEGPDGLRISMGETVKPYRRERILLVETNIDDMNPQGFELLYARLFEAGALDVWVQTILMKKMRPAFKLSVLCEHTKQGEIAEVIFKETTSLGVRFLELDRFSLERKIVPVKTKWGKVRVKIAELEGRKMMSPEYDDLKRISQKTKLPFREVYAKVKNQICSSPLSKI